jgi:hypothetical protein
LALGVTLALAALLLLSGTPSTSARIASGLISSLAGGIIGASLSILVNRSFDYSALARMRLTLERTISSTLTAPEHEISDLRVAWHQYHLTVVEGRPKWTYTAVPFDNNAAIGSLTADVGVLDARSPGVTHVYRMEAATRGARLILTELALRGDEAPAVSVFPHIRHGFRSVHAGFAVLQTWDGDEVLTPTLLSQHPLIPTGEPGLVGADGAVTLDAEWREALGSVRVLLPAGAAMLSYDSKPAAS